MSTLIHSIWTVVLFFVFLGIVAWAYSSGKKKDFEEASRLALDDDNDLDDDSDKVSEKNKPEN